MPSMTKRVNVTTTIPVRTITPPLSGTYKDIIMSTGDILKCISRRAIVDEILPNGMTIRLTIGNYYKDNGAGLDAAERAAASKVADEEKVEDHKSEEETVTHTEEEQAPEAPVEPEVTADNETATSNEEETEGDKEAPVVETDNDNVEPEASVDPTVDAGVAQVAEEPPIDETDDTKANEETAVTSVEEETAGPEVEEGSKDKQPTKKTTSKKGSSSKKTTTKKAESVIEAAAEGNTTE